MSRWLISSGLTCWVKTQKHTVIIFLVHFQQKCLVLKNSLIRSNKRDWFYLIFYHNCLLYTSSLVIGAFIFHLLALVDDCLRPLGKQRMLWDTFVVLFLFILGVNVTWLNNLKLVLFYRRAFSYDFYVWFWMEIKFFALCFACKSTNRSI